MPPLSEPNPGTVQRLCSACAPVWSCPFSLPSRALSPGPCPWHPLFTLSPLNLPHLVFSHNTHPSEGFVFLEVAHYPSFLGDTSAGSLSLTLLSLFLSLCLSFLSFIFHTHIQFLCLCVSFSISRLSLSLIRTYSQIHTVFKSQFCSCSVRDPG